MLFSTQKTSQWVGIFGECWFIYFHFDLISFDFILEKNPEATYQAFYSQLVIIVIYIEYLLCVKY